MPNNNFSAGFSNDDGPANIRVYCEGDNCSISGSVEMEIVVNNGETVHTVKQLFGPPTLSTKMELTGDSKADEIGSAVRQRAVTKTSGESGGEGWTSSQESEPTSAEYSLEPSSTEYSLEDHGFYFPTFGTAKEAAYNVAHRVWDASRHIHFYHLPDWLKDNEYLHYFHRPPTPSLIECAKSIFRLHTETGNIWTHLIGTVVFIGLAVCFLMRPETEIPLQDKLVFSTFFVGAIFCLGTSFLFHTIYCYSERVGRLFNRLDYVGILLMIIGSFIPWVYYGFYCHRHLQITYLVVVIFLGSVVMVLSMAEKFSGPKYRTIRAIAFAAFGLFGIVPFFHFIIAHGFHPSQFWLIAMALFYLFGAFLYAARIPERFLPGKCDIVFQSHQLFHICVVVAAFAHYRGTVELADELAERRKSGIFWCRGL